MATNAIEVIDIDGRVEVSRLVDEMEATGKDVVVLRRHGRNVALISPVRPEGAPLPAKEITDEDRAASRAAAGGWVGNVDFDALRRALAESRSIPTKPPVDLGDFGKTE